MRKLIERTLGPLTDSEFTELLDLVTTDIYINNVRWGKRTSPAEMVQIAEITWRMLQRCRVA